MAFEIKPLVSKPNLDPSGFPLFLQWQSDGINAGDRGVRVVNFTGKDISCSRGTGEHENVITVMLKATGGGGGGGGGGGVYPPCMMLLDNFDGSAGTPIQNHTPDASPSGFAWAKLSAAETQLDGIGNFTTTGTNTVAAGRAIGFSAPSLGPKFTAVIVAKMPG